MQPHLNELEKLKKISRKISKQHSTIFDVVLFGSVLKGKWKPGDIDVCIVLSEKADPKEIEVISREFPIEVHLTHVLLTELYSQSLWLTLLHEGFSLIRNKYLYKIFGMEPWIIFSYNLITLKPVEKSRFSHALFGRAHEGIFYKLGGKILGKGSIMVPVKHSEEIREVLERWHIDYKVKKMFIW